jgi:hypothetical protein
MSLVTVILTLPACVLSSHPCVLVPSRALLWMVRDELWAED